MDISIITSQKLTLSDNSIEVVKDISKATKEFVLFLDKNDKLIGDIGYFRTLNVNSGVDIVQFSHLRENEDGIYIKKDSIPAENIQTFSNSSPNYKCIYDKFFRRSSVIKMLESEGSFNIDWFINRKLQFVNKVLLIHMIFDKIDFVFPYVSNSDPEWQKAFKGAKREKYAAKNDWSEGEIRYRDMNTLKYFFRALEENMPWLHKVYMVVMQDSQVPSWINRETVNIIYHKDFIPPSNLPTFNCSEIEMFMAKLPNVEENIIWGNDDMFIMKHQEPKNWFRYGKPVYEVKYKSFNPLKAPGDWLRLMDYNLNHDTFQLDKCVDVPHGPIPYKMTLLKRFFNENEHTMRKSCSHFRENFNLNQWVFAEYQYLKKETYNEPKSIVSTELNKEKVKSKAFWESADIICINDASGESYIADALKYLKERFPNKSIYEV